ncbi:hypothetical protein ADUPG1_000919 [Aduncisulcus paluster]|uniref:Uncharacterized protein n=1 Tax=Aduncisulcus paluster TaxID=2918883 RepID=A0ABQ5KCE6_9EUKA|nr:hypothetical protein ADUPG1_000919 [Aduncisulcus paluster]
MLDLTLTIGTVKTAFSSVFASIDSDITAICGIHSEVKPYLHSVEMKQLINFVYDDVSFKTSKTKFNSKYFRTGPDDISSNIIPTLEFSEDYILSVFLQFCSVEDFCFSKVDNLYLTLYIECRIFSSHDHLLSIILPTICTTVASFRLDMGDEEEEEEEEDDDAGKESKVPPLFFKDNMRKALLSTRCSVYSDSTGFQEIIERDGNIWMAMGSMKTLSGEKSTPRIIYIPPLDGKE